MTRIFFIAVVVASQPAWAAEIDFDTEIVPLLSKAGCNAASCHGGAAGQAGFRLSLFGGNPEFDHRTIVRELEGRRIDLVRPDESLVLAKPTGQLEHGGGEVIDLDGKAAKKISAWIASGAGRLQIRQLEQLHVSPSEFTADQVPVTAQIRVTAIFNDGVRRDVTDAAVYVTQNEAAVRVDSQGTMTVLRPGRHHVVVRFASQVKTVSVMSPIGAPGLPSSHYPRANWIDEEINASLETLRIAVAPSTDDYGFLRRLSLDLIGRLPTAAAVTEFASDPDPHKRSRRIGELVNSVEFSEFWTHTLGTWLRIRNPGVDTVAGATFHAWIQRCVHENVGWDQMARELVLSEGDTHQNGAATVHRFFATAREEAEYVSEVLMGVRLRCANCHNHPLDRWTQDDYHGLAAIFAKLQRGQVVRVSDRGDNIHPRTGMPAAARIPGEGAIQAPGHERQRLVQWLTSPTNPYFARAIVGRVWESLMGRGLVTPVDDHRATNPPSHPRLLDRLAEYFIEQDYQIRPLVELICNSAAYARTSTSDPVAEPEPDDRFYSHSLVKPLSAEVLADAISDVTGVHEDYSQVSLERRRAPATMKMKEFDSSGRPGDLASQPVDRAINAVDRTKTLERLEVLGQCIPGEGCSSVVGSERGIATKLHLLNGDLLNKKIVSPQGRLAELFDQDAPVDRIVSELFLRALSRPPNEHERVSWRQRIQSGHDRRHACEDFLWALLNCHEFTTNH